MYKAVAGFIGKVGILHGIAVLVLLIASTTVLINRGGSIVTLIAGSAASLGNETVLYLTAAGTTTLEIGETEDLDVRINTKTPINAVGATLVYPEGQLEIVGISKAKSFLDLWTEETTIKEGVGEVRFSGGTTGKTGLSGVGTIVTLTVRAKKAGKAEISFKDAQVLAADGKGTEVPSSKRIFTFTVPLSNEPVAAAGGRMNQETLPPASIDFNEDGKVNVVDLSIIAIQILGPYNAKFDLDRDGKSSLSDLSIFFTRMRLP
jgi:hypothetical protein